MLEEMGKRAREAAQRLAQVDGQRRDAVLRAMAASLRGRAEEILGHNALDMEKARRSGMSDAFLDRLSLNHKRINDMAEGLIGVAALPDPLARILHEETRPNGLLIRRVPVPLGVAAVIYEARPNVTADAAALCIKSGNAVILRGGKEAARSNAAIAEVLRGALAEEGLPEDAVQWVRDTSRASAEALMRLRESVDVLLPRGGRDLIRTVLQNARVPVIETGEGVCHIYVDKKADPAMAAEIIFNAKTSRPSVCNAVECMLIHRDASQRALPLIAQRLGAGGVVIRGDERVRAIVPFAEVAVQEDWGKEYLDLIIAARMVDSIDEAMDHIRLYGTGHSEAIITEDTQARDSFLSAVDAAAVYHNASTRFTDGGEFGFGAEIGISTQKLHARGPVGVEQLTSYKYVICGNGQVRV